MSDNGTALATRREPAAAEHELQTAAAEAAATQEIQSALIIAKRFPRNEELALQQILKSCQRLSFAAEAQYKFPRAGQQVEGPSVYFAREIARVWGNIVYGHHDIYDDDLKRTIRCFAWDLQSNARSCCDATFKKLIQRKQGGKAQWVEPDERDLRELTNKHAAIGKRNCILELIPQDVVNEAIKEAEATLQVGATRDPDNAKKAIIKAFIEIGVPADGLARYLGHSIGLCTPAEIAALRGVYKSIKDGNSTWTEHEAQKEQERAAAQPAKPEAAKPEPAAKPAAKAGKGKKAELPRCGVEQEHAIVMQLERTGMRLEEVLEPFGAKALNELTQAEAEQALAILKGAPDGAAAYEREPGAEG